MALRLSIPFTLVASFPNFWSKASLRLCAGSVDISNTLSRCLASWIAREHDVVVLPTPPLPPTNIQRRDFWSRIDWRVGSIGSRSSDIFLKFLVFVVQCGWKLASTNQTSFYIRFEASLLLSSLLGIVRLDISWR